MTGRRPDGATAPVRTSTSAGAALLAERERLHQRRGRAGDRLERVHPAGEHDDDRRRAGRHHDVDERRLDARELEVHRVAGLAHGRARHQARPAGDDHHRHVRLRRDHGGLRQAGRVVARHRAARRVEDLVLPVGSPERGERRDVRRVVHPERERPSGLGQEGDGLLGHRLLRAVAGGRAAAWRSRCGPGSGSRPGAVAGRRRRDRSTAIEASGASGSTPSLVSTTTAWLAARRARARWSGVSNTLPARSASTYGPLEQAEAELEPEDPPHRLVDHLDREPPGRDLGRQLGEAVGRRQLRRRGRRGAPGPPRPPSSPRSGGACGAGRPRSSRPRPRRRSRARRAAGR